MTIAFQGACGAFSHEACLTFAPDHDPIARPSFASVVAAVIDGEADLGILPVENTTAGPVPGVSELLADEAIALLSSHVLPIRVHLLALPGVRFEDITTIISHPMALAQCAETLRAIGLPTESASNTAAAASALDSRAKAVLASDAAAKAYGLDIVRRDLHDCPDNATRFSIFGRAGAP